MSNISTPVKHNISKQTFPAKQKLRRSPRKVVDKKKVGYGDCVIVVFRESQDPLLIMFKSSFGGWVTLFPPPDKPQ